MKKNTIIAALCLLFSQILYSQSTVTNFYTLMDSLYANDSSLMVPDSLRRGSIKEVDRMKHDWGMRLSPHGSVSIAGNAIYDYTNTFNNQSGGQGISSNYVSASWQAEGPFGNPTGGNNAGSSEGNGQIHRIVFDPQYNNPLPGGGTNETIYACSFYGGLWRTDDKGINWHVVNTDQLPQTTVSGVAISYQNNNNLYICTGKGEDPKLTKNPFQIGHEMPIYTNGIYKSSDRGMTWNEINTGFYSDFINGGTAREIRIDPQNENNLFVATTNGLYRCTTAVTNPTWDNLKVLGSPTNNDFRGIEFKPGNSNVLYLSSDEIYKIDNPASPSPTWTKLTGPGTTLDFSSLPNQFSSERINIATSPDNPNRLYAYIYGKNSVNGEVAYIYSIDYSTTSPQWIQHDFYIKPSTDREDLSASWLALAVSPVNEDELYYGFTHVRGSKNMGTIPFDLYSTYVGFGFHADVQALVFEPNITNNPRLYAGNHGGICKNLMSNNTVSNSWEYINTGLNVSLNYSFDFSKIDKDIRILARQDCGISYSKKVGQSYIWTHNTLGGDGFGANIYNDENNPKFIYNINNLWNRTVLLPFNAAFVATDANFNPPLTTATYKASNVNFFPRSFNVIEHPITNKPVFGFSDLYTLPNNRLHDDLFLGVSSWTIQSDLYRETRLKDLSNFDVMKLSQFRRILDFDFSKSNPDYIYLITSGHYGLNSSTGQIEDNETILWKSTTGLKNGVYEKISPNTPVSTAAQKFDILNLNSSTNLKSFINYNSKNYAPFITDIVVSTSNPDILWISCSGFTQGVKVLKSIDGGITWTNEDPNNSLPNMPANNLVYQDGTNDRLYLATDVGVYVKDNTMSDWSRFGDIPNVRVNELKISSCENKLYAATYGRGIWSVDLLPSTGIISEQEITTNTTWDNNRVLERNIRVKSGATLTIEGTVYMPAMGKIIVEPNAELIVDGGTITNNCQNFWEGIEVRGDEFKDQTQLGSNGTPLYMGRVELLNNATISYANVGVALFEEGITGTGGGLIQATEANFINCRTAVEFQKLRTTNHSFFRRCNFEIDAMQSNTANGDFNAHVRIFDTDGINFYGCSFKNNNSNFNTFNTSNDKGIFSLNASYQVIADCNPTSGAPTSPCPSQYLTRSSFENLNIGIHATGAATEKYVIINEADFTDNAIGVQINNVEYSQVVLNNFYIGDEQKQGAINVLDFQFGLRTQNTSGYEIEQNTFEKTGTDPASGIEIANSGTEANQIYKNTFKNLDLGQMFKGRNRNTSPYEGTQFLCNVNAVSNERDVDIAEDPNAPGTNNHGIRDFQGSSSTRSGSFSAENDFSDSPNSTEGHIRNSTNNPVTYYYKNSAWAPSIRLVTSAKVMLQQISQDNTCNTRFVGVGGVSGAPSNSSISEYYTLRNQYDATLYTYFQNIDGGNTDSLIQAINLTFPSEAQELRDNLMAEAPYLSSEALMDAANTGVLTDAFLLEICLANPDATRDEGFLDYVEFEIPNPLPSSMVQLIYQNWDAETPRTLLENELADLNADLGYRSDNLIRAYVSDTLDHFDSVISVLQSRKSLASKYRQIELNLNRENFEEATNLFTEIDNNMELGESLIPEHNNLQNYAQVIENIVNSGQSLLDLEEGFLNDLRQIAANKTGRSSGMAQNILCYGYGECDDNSGEGELRKKAGRIYYMEEAYNENIGLSAISVVPNPANEFVSIQTDGVDLSNCRMIIFNVLGEKVMDRKILHQHQKINLSHLDKGVYIYQIIQNETDIIQKERLILN